jgi:hypothetical protein
VGGTDTGTTVSNGGVRDGELTKVVSNHLSLDFDVLEDLSVVNTNDAANHLGNDDHITQVGLNGLGLLSQIGVDGTLGLAELLDQVGLLALEATGETAADAAREQLDELLVAHNQELIKINSTVGELTEDTLLTGALGLSLKSRKKKANFGQHRFLKERLIPM